MWEPSLETCCTIRRLHYPPGILEALSSCPLLSSPLPSPLSFFFLTVAQQGAISHSAQRGLEELKATEQKKNRKRRGVERAEEVGRAGVRPDEAHGEMEGLGIKGRRWAK